MRDKLETDLKKYEDEIALVNKRLTELDEQRAQLITHGRRCEGIASYIRAQLAELKAKEDEKQPAPVGDSAK